jgi:hypothetical protein
MKFEIVIYSLLFELNAANFSRTGSIYSGA